MKTIAVIARKGGSGKTTLAVHLAIAAHHAGFKTLLVDADAQSSATEVLKVRGGEGPRIVTCHADDLFAAHRQAQADGVEAMIIDTPAGSEEQIAPAIAASQLSLLAVRPTFLDIAASVQTARLLRRVHKPGMIVLTQAPVPRGGCEPPAVRNALEALRLMQLPVIPSIIRSRAAYQTSFVTGRAAQEAVPGSPAAIEMERLWFYLQRFVFGETGRRIAS